MSARKNAHVGERKGGIGNDTYCFGGNSQVSEVVKRLLITYKDEACILQRLFES